MQTLFDLKKIAAHRSGLASDRQHTAFLLRALVIGFPVFIQLEALPGYGSVRFDVIGKLKGLLLPVHGLLEIAGLRVGGSERAEECGILVAVQLAGLLGGCHGSLAVAKLGVGAGRQQKGPVGQSACELWIDVNGRVKVGESWFSGGGLSADEKLKRVVSTILAENREMRAICQKLGFRMEADLDDGTIGAELLL